MGSVFAQETDMEALPEEYRYYVPLPETTFFQQWHFVLELIAQDAPEYSISLEGYNPQGERVMFQETTTYQGSEVFVWEDAETYTLSRLQSLVVIADSPLSGNLWMWNDSRGIMNGVSLAETVADTLVMPHIPSNFFAWLTTFSVAGVSDHGLPGELSFSYRDPVGYQTASLWNGLEPNGSYAGAPYHDFFIAELGVDPSMTWGRIHTDDPEYRIAGYQTLRNNDNFTRSGAVELNASGSSAGYIGVSRVEGWNFDNWFAFTNPSEGDVVIDFSLQYRVPVLVEEEEVIEVRSLTQSVVVAPFERKNLILGSSELFPGHPADIVSLSYQAHDSEDASLPRPVFALHLQPNGLENGLGAHHFSTETGSELKAVLNLGAGYETLYEIFNPGERPLGVRYVILDAAGNEIHDGQLKTGAGDMLSITSAQLGVELAEQLGEESVTGVYRIEFRRTLGALFHGKITAFRGSDTGSGLCGMMSKAGFWTRAYLCSPRDWTPKCNIRRTETSWSHDKSFLLLGKVKARSKGRRPPAWSTSSRSMSSG